MGKWILFYCTVFVVDCRVVEKNRVFLHLYEIVLNLCKKIFAKLKFLKCIV